MVKLNYASPELKFDHLVVFEQDHTIFAAARQSNNYLRIFLVYEDTNRVYTRNGTADSWEQLSASDASVIRNRVKENTGSIPLFRIAGAHA